MTAKQKAARAKFKAVVKEAGKLRKKNPSLTQAEAVKQAWAINYGKKQSSLGYSKEREKIHKAATSWIKRDKKLKPDLDKNSLLARSYEMAPYGKVGVISYYGDGKIIWAENLKIDQKYEWIIGAEYLEIVYLGYSKNFPNVRAGATFGDGRFLFQFVKSKGYVKLSERAVRENLRTIPNEMSGLKNKKATPTKVKAKKGKRTSEMHTDTKSHNVNIRVVSGIGAIKSSGVKMLQKKFGILAAKKLMKKKKSEARKLQREMTKVKTQLKKLLSL